MSDSEKVKKAIFAYAFMEAMTGGHVSDFLVKPSPQKPKSLCERCSHNIKEPYLCRNCTKILYDTTEILVNKCTGFEEIKETD